jgi:tRNA-dihydrouridine synthase
VPAVRHEEGERHRAADEQRVAPLQERVDDARAASHHRWVINKLRALGSWYTKGLENGSHLRTAINSAETLGQLRDIVSQFFCETGVTANLV